MSSEPSEPRYPDTFELPVVSVVLDDVHEVADDGLEQVGHVFGVGGVEWSAKSEMEQVFLVYSTQLSPQTAQVRFFS